MCKWKEGGLQEHESKKNRNEERGRKQGMAVSSPSLLHYRAHKKVFITILLGHVTDDGSGEDTVILGAKACH